MHRLLFALMFFLPILATCKGLDNISTAHSEKPPIIKRPLVTVVPIIDNSNNRLPWSVATSLSLLIQKNLEQKKHLYLTDENSISTRTKRIICKNDPFGLNTTWIKKTFQQNEFIVFIELLKHKEIPFDAQLPEKSSAELHLMMRIRIFDIRKETPKVVLEEVVQKFHHIPKQFNQYNFTQVPYNDEAFEISPLGIVHETISQEICDCIEDYILLAGD